MFSAAPPSYKSSGDGGVLVYSLAAACPDHRFVRSFVLNGLRSRVAAAAAAAAAGALQFCFCAPSAIERSPVVSPSVRSFVPLTEDGGVEKERASERERERGRENALLLLTSNC